MLIPIVCVKCGTRGKVAALPDDLECVACGTGEHLDLDDRTAQVDPSDPMPLGPSGTPEQDQDMPLGDPERTKMVPTVPGAPPYSDRALATPINAARRVAAEESLRLCPQHAVGVKVPVRLVAPGEDCERCRRWGVPAPIEPGMMASRRQAADTTEWYVVRMQARDEAARILRDLVNAGGGSRQVSIAGVPYIFYYDQQGSVGDSGRSVPGSVTGEIEVFRGTDVVGAKEVVRQHVSPTGQGSDTVGYAIRVAADAVADNVVRFATGSRKQALTHEEWGRLSPTERRDWMRKATPAERAEMFGPHHDVAPSAPESGNWRAQGYEWNPGYSGPGGEVRDQFFDDYYREPGDPVYASKVDQIVAAVRKANPWMGLRTALRVAQQTVARYPAVATKKAADGDAIDLLVQSKDGAWPHRFRLNGREYTMFPGGPSAHCADYSEFAVFAPGGGYRFVKVRPDSKVEVLTYVSSGSGYEYTPDGQRYFGSKVATVSPTVGKVYKVTYTLDNDSDYTEEGLVFRTDGDSVWFMKADGSYRRVKATSTTPGNQAVAEQALRAYADRTVAFSPGSNGQKNMAGLLREYVKDADVPQSVKDQVLATIADIPSPSFLVQMGSRTAGSASDVCPKCGAHMDDVTVANGVLTARCKACGWSGTKRQASRKQAMPNPVDEGVKVGDFFVSSWGYDQTNIDFYEVTGLTPASVKVRQVSKQYQGNRQAPQVAVVPVPGAYVGEEMTRRLSSGGWGRPAFTVNSFAVAFLWDGKPKWETGTGWGH